MLQIGKINKNVINLLALDVEVDTPIFLGDTNIEHMKQSHSDDYEQYKDEIPNIICNPDYVGINPNDKSIEYVKIYNEFVKVAIRISNGNIYFARSIYARDRVKMERFIKKGYLKKYI